MIVLPENTVVCVPVGLKLTVVEESCAPKLPVVAAV